MRSLRRRGRQEDGVVLVIVAISLVVFLGLAALAIDLGSLYQAQRQAQSAADAGALAGAVDLPGSAGSATTDATNYATTNLPGATPSATSPYQSSSSEIHVTVTKTVPTFFAQIFGASSETVSASATAGPGPGTVPSAVFAGDTSCGGDGINVPGSSITVTGGVHSNGSLIIPGSSSSFGKTTYGGPNSCSPRISGSGNTFGGKSTPTTDATSEPWPYDYSKSPPTCTFSATSYNFNTDGATIPSGVYCATNSITLNGNRMSGNITLMAPSITLNSSNSTFTSYSNGLFAYQTGTGNLQLNSSGLSCGTIFAPNAEIQVTGGNGGVLTGFLEAKDVSISGSGWSFNGTGPPLSGSGTALIQ